jgi:aminoglycoside phosphotransferase (APT) family kinase protein
MEAPPPEIRDALHRLGLLSHEAEDIAGERLTGGVSSDIWRIDLPGGPICVKRALPKLRVAAEWHVPVERNIYEARWMQRANAAVPGAAPALLGQDNAAGVLAMAFLPPDTHKLWKTELSKGHADPAFAALTGSALVRIHATSAADPTTKDEFPTGDIFYDIRLEPYLIATAEAHPDLAATLHALVHTTQSNGKALVHGDVSPKNILQSPDGPVFLDAECAWWGDPAFDIAFCLNHLLLKCLWTPSARKRFLDCFHAMATTYLAGVTWEPAAELERRAAALLPGLFLARVDGKSPVEYITTDADRNRVRRVARILLQSAPNRLQSIADAWAKELTA